MEQPTVTISDYATRWEQKRLPLTDEHLSLLQNSPDRTDHLLYEAHISLTCLISEFEDEGGIVGSSFRDSCKEALGHIASIANSRNPN